MTTEEREIRNQKILEEIQTKTCKEVAEMFGLSLLTVQKIVKNAGLKLNKSRVNMSKISLDLNYFNQIDDPRKAYWLGFIAADGSINKTNAKLTFNIKDLEILEKFKNDVKSGHKLVKTERFDKRTNKTYIGYSLQVTNAIFVGNIIKWGITNQKTDVLAFPNIKEEYYSYFIAGLFDGDGSVYIRNVETHQQIGCNLISTKEVLEFIQEYLFQKFNMSKTTLQKISKNKTNVWKCYWQKDTKKFLNFIYSGDKDVYLSRKYDKYLECLQINPSRKRFQPILQYSLDGRFLHQFNTIKEAGEFINCDPRRLANVARKNKIWKDYIWVLYDEDNEIKDKINVENYS